MPNNPECGKNSAIIALDRQEMLDDLAARRNKSALKGQIDNVAMPPGSLIFYYCRYCGVPTDTKEEGWYQKPASTLCDECGDLTKLGWHDGLQPSFPIKSPEQFQ